jgi:predicted nucleotidyltransferase
MPLPIDIPMDEIKKLCAKYQVKELALFGSVLRPDFRDDSDIDVLVEFEPDAQIGLMAFTGLMFDLSDLLHRKVDLVPKDGLKPLIRRPVLESAQVIYEER